MVSGITTETQLQAIKSAISKISYASVDEKFQQ